jgi:cytochrome c peroxidase
MLCFRFTLSLAVSALALSSPTLAQGPGPGGPGPLQPPPAPPGNPVTAAKTDLGMALFWDEQLSSTRSVACGTCHIPSAGGSDPRSIAGSFASINPGADQVFGTADDVVGSPGVPRSRPNGQYNLDAIFGVKPQVTGRKTPSAIGVGYSPSLFWDGRAGNQLVDPITNAVVLPFGAALENQVLGPPVSTAEMAHDGRDWNDVATRIANSKPLQLSPLIPPSLQAWIANRSYPQLFLEAYGSTAVTPVRIAMAIATYERSLVPNQTRFDQSLAGNQSLTPQEQQGLQLFNSINCVTCHTGNRLTNDQFFNIGVRPIGEDVGRFAVTGNLGDRGRFKVPSLRNVELRAPYFHNGSQATLVDVVNFYNRGGDFNSPTKDPRIVPLGLSGGQRAALVAFLSAPLTDNRVILESGPFERPLLYTETNLAPSLFGAPTPGTSGVRPRASVVEPAQIQNPNLTIAMDRGFGGAPAFLAFDMLANTSGTQVLGMTSYLGLTSSLIIRSTGFLAGAGPGQGFKSVTIPLNFSPSAIGTSVFGQWMVYDPTSPGGMFSATEAFELRLF